MYCGIAGMLEDTLKEETTSPDFSELPNNYLEIAKVLLERFVS